MQAAREIVRTSGVLALWRGNGATMVRIMPHAGIVVRARRAAAERRAQLVGETRAQRGEERRGEERAYFGLAAWRARSQPRN
jgi:hypothetical protein